MRFIKDNSRFEEKMKRLSEKNREHVTKFMNDCYAEGLSRRRVLKYQGQILNIIKWLGMNLQDVKKEDMKRLVGEIERSDYMEWTKHDYKVTIKRFWKWLRQTEDTYPEEVRWIKTTMRNSRSKLPEDLLSQEDVRKLIESAVNFRDKALISFLYESGCRIGEVLGMKIKDVTMEEPACAVRVSGKKGSRRILVVDSTPYLANWISHCENRDDPDSYLWTCIGTKNRNKVLCYNSVRELIRSISRKAGVKKRVNPHTFRHSRATHLANKLTEAQMCEYLGWVQGSGMPKVYVHLSGRDVDNAILELHGLKKPEDDINNRELKFKECKICGKTNEFEAKICRRCGRPLDIKSALELENKEKKFMDMITPKMVDDMIKDRIKEILEKKGMNESEQAQDGFQ